MTSHTDRKDEVGTGMTYEEYIHSRLPEIEEAEAKSRYGSLPRRRRHCYEVFPCPRQAAHDSMLQERDELKREVERFKNFALVANDNENIWKDRAEKAEAEAKELREELGRSRGLREAAMAFRDCASINHWEPLVKAALAYRMEQGKKEDAAQVPADTPADDESCLQQIVITTPSGNGYDVPDWNKTFEVRDYFRSRLAPRRVSREWLYQTAGELSTFRFSNQHPGAALTWLGNMLRSLGIEVADV